MRSSGDNGYRWLALLLLLSGAHAESSEVYDLRLRLSEMTDSIEVVLENSPYETAYVPDPMVEWQPGTGGFELRAWTVAGRQSAPCVMKDFVGDFQRRSRMEPGQKIALKFELDEVRRDFCLAPGEYFVQAIFHNEVAGVEISGSIISNPVHLIIN